MSIFNTNFSKWQAPSICLTSMDDINWDEVTEMIRDMSLERDVGKDGTNGLDAHLYYLYVHLLKWKWAIVEMSNDLPSRVIKIESPLTGRIKTFAIGGRP